MTPSIVIIADDLTGACDTGAAFARVGLRTFVVLDMQHDLSDVAGVDVVVYTTESRYLPVAQAVQAVERVARAREQSGLSTELQPSRHAVVYKKIDSTLRGHPGDELARLMQCLNTTRALVAPAFPAQGRTTLDAHQLVNGQPIEHTPFASEVQSGDLRAAFSGRGYLVHAIGLDRVRCDNDSLMACLRDLEGIIVADAETDADLTALAIAARGAGITLLCGSAGLAQAVSQMMTSAAAPARRSAGTSPAKHGPVLVVAGSCNPVTLGQIEFARDHGVTVVPVPQELMNINATVAGAVFTSAQVPAPALIALVHQVTACLEARRNVVVTTAGLPESPLGKDVIAKRLGEIAAQVLANTRPGALVLTGGDIATAVCGALGAHTLELHDELQPGIASGTLADGPYAGIRIITKAGGFGGVESLWEIIREMGD